MPTKMLIPPEKSKLLFWIELEIPKGPFLSSRMTHQERNSSAGIPLIATSSLLIMQNQALR